MNYTNKTKEELIEELEALKDELDRLKGTSAIRTSNAGLHGEKLPAEEDDAYRSFTELAGGILDCIPANIALINNSGKILAVNSAWKRFAFENSAPGKDYYLGLNYLEICEKSGCREYPEASNAAKGIRNVLLGQSPRFSLEYPCHSEKEKRWYRLFVTPFDFKGEKCAVIMHINVTEHVRVEKMLTESEHKLLFNKASTIINSALDSILITSPEGVIVEVNEEACRRLGYTREEMLRMTMWDLCLPENFSHDEGRFKETCQKGSAVFETVHLKRDGTPVPMEFSTKQVEYSGSKVIVAIGRDITSRKHNEEILVELNKEAMVTSAALLHAIPDMILLLSSDGVFLDSHIPEGNSEEYPLKDFIGKKLSEVLPQLVTEKTVQSFKEVLKSGKIFVMDFPLELEGKQFFYEARAVRCGENELLLLLRNITEKKKAEEEIHKLSLVVEQSPVIVLITDKQGKISYVNPRFTEVTGYTLEEAIGARPHMLKSGLTPASQYKELWKKLEKGEHWKGEFCNRKKNGELFWELASIFPLKNFMGEVTHFVAVKEDITERKETELRLIEYGDHLEQIVEQRTESLRKVNQLLSVRIEKHKAAEGKIENQLQFLKTLFRTIPNPLLVKNKEGRIIDCNEAYESYFKLELKDIKHKRAEDILPPHVLDKILEMEKTLYTNPGHVSVELASTRGNGEPFAVLVSEATYLEADGSIGGTVAIMIDISEQKKLQEKIQAALQKEQELNELKSSFISMASHEFRTPLTSILASADLLEMFGRQWKEEKYMEHIAKIQKGVDYMKELLDDVLVISRNEEGKTQFIPAKTNFLELCSELFDSAKLISTGNHKFIYNYEPKQKIFTIDPKLARHIISNLLSNAVKYSPRGGKVILNVKAEDNNLLIDVIDEGIGIPEADKAKLYEPFHRAGNTTSIHGTGLGMSIVKRSVELHHGQISVESQENSGTSAHVILPYKP
ncbi:MAG: PAS domain S-box protein [Ignavibacteria bacterium]|jgi:PAS domain S-box-containing protein|nr:PAS domain S-box protein [Ignavibacteria bacterium]